ncbi:transcriptional regulator [Bordetella ansorpii]|uniref:Transcriptional regulator n=1 Tax=Bordetella ansorpii TaxID=288768 RepID=A0A157SV85_9BORD|nr:helix-turn-helix domain-containing protein [Bordetella ansorpii]SAI74357.1 transcriptional regulator [Bordetella ansorpii]
MKADPAPADPPARPASLSEKMQRGDLMAVACPSREVLKHMTSRWGVLVLIALLPGTQRFSDLRRTVSGVSERMLAQTLQWLEGDGIVRRRAFKVVPPHVEYSLTPLGREAAERVQGLADWIEVNMPAITAHWEAAGARPEPEKSRPEDRLTA